MHNVCAVPVLHPSASLPSSSEASVRSLQTETFHHHLRLRRLRHRLTDDSYGTNTRSQGTLWRSYGSESCSQCAGTGFCLFSSVYKAGICFFPELYNALQGTIRYICNSIGDRLLLLHLYKANYVAWKITGNLQDQCLHFSVYIYLERVCFPVTNCYCCIVCDTFFMGL